ncbi:hypothetical protein FIBSPDRAFT_1053627 [Athelia psychrophila]|uniref:Uncharacterized protein n=1 Tax=Athelia psychrophila TaxID=1759441 RepID=A0A167WM93_9AGAM|nr:hypothetical protein FIBSPDRAFT_1053627 [Fibularhizoctonia sp. CBS 109695]
MEVQAQYILKIIAPAPYGAASSFSVTPTTCDAYNARIQRRLEGLVLMRCVSWYRAEGGTGKVTSVFSGPVTLFWWWMRKPVWGDYEVVKRGEVQEGREEEEGGEVVGIPALVVAPVGLSQLRGSGVWGEDDG